MYYSIFILLVDAKAEEEGNNPSNANMDRLEELINQGDVASFWSDEELKGWYITFLHTYGVCAKDKVIIKDQIEKNNKSLFDILTFSDQAFVILVYVNNYEGWCEKRTGGVGDKVQKQCKGRWTKPSKNREVGLYGNGWDQEGLDFYHKAEDFFKKLHGDKTRDEEMRKRATSWWKRNVRGEVEGVPPLSDGSMNLSLARLCYSISGKYRKTAEDLSAAVEEEEVDTSFVGIRLQV